MLRVLSLLALMTVCAEAGAAPKAMSAKQQFVKRLEAKLAKGIEKRNMREATRMFLQHQIRRAQSDSFVVKRGRLVYVGDE